MVVITLILISAFNGKEPRKFNYKVLGTGKPTIVIDVAMGETLQSWAARQTKLSRLTTVATYDRLGLGKSDWRFHLK